MLTNIRIVLVGTTHPGNIGAAARAMKNMCLDNLVLVAPKQFPHAEATARASGADSVLEKARVVATLDEAITDCRLVIGASARLRTVQWPILQPKESSQRLVREARTAPVALVFGRESSGLSNQELDRCNYLVNIPTGVEYSSLNLAAAVQVLVYEILLASTVDSLEPIDQERELATATQMSGFFTHLAQALEDIGFSNPRQSEKLLRRLRALFHRARPDEEEINILRGILSAAQGRKSMRRS